MAYFANGSEGDYYEEEWCQRCVHYGGETGVACPVLVLHCIWNYDACNGDQPDASPDAAVKHTALNTLWPRDGIDNGRCAMFYEKTEDGANDASQEITDEF